LPLRLALALGTDLSPDEAYYLAAARAKTALPPLRDHPPLVPLLLRVTDRLEALPVELRVRLWAILFSLSLSLAVVWLARRRGVDLKGQTLAAWLSSFSLLPVAGGFVTTPDGPALLAFLILLAWAAPTGEAAPRPALHRIGAALGIGCVAALGAVGKVVLIPLVVTIALFARGRSVVERACLLLPLAFAAPLLAPSLAFQLQHAYAQQAPYFTLLRALGALLAALFAQALLWTPWPLVAGARNLREGPPAERAIALVMTVLVAASALARAVPPEPNWYAPAALILVISASRSAQDLAPRARRAMLAALLVPTAVAAAHTLHPFLPLRADSDPTARLHGWRDGHPPVHAAGVGPYGPAAERCVYQFTCEEIDEYFQTLNK